MNGNETGQKHQSARELTAEIDQATNLVVKSQEIARAKESSQAQVENARDMAPLESETSRGVDRTRVGDFGAKVLTYNPELGAAERRSAEKAERVHELAEYDDGNYTYADSEDLIGVETKTQVAERIDEDREDIANEQGENGTYVKAIMDRNNKRITKETVAAVDNLISKHEYHPGQLYALTNKARTTFLKDVFNRILGSRN